MAHLYAVLYTGSRFSRDARERSHGGRSASRPHALEAGDLALAPRQLLVFNTAVVAAGVGGSISLAHDGPYDALVGKTVALEPATGFSFDSPLSSRPR
jgi:hypothetical protein